MGHFRPRITECPYVPMSNMDFKHACTQREFKCLGDEAHRPPTRACSSTPCTLFPWRLDVGPPANMSGACSAYIGLNHSPRFLSQHMPHWPTSLFLYRMTNDITSWCMHVCGSMVIYISWHLNGRGGSISVWERGVGQNVSYIQCSLYTSLEAS